MWSRRPIRFLFSQSSLLLSQVREVKLLPAKACRLETELLLGGSSSVVDGTGSLILCVLDSLVCLVSSGFLGILNSLSGSILSTFNGILGTLNGIGSSAFNSLLGTTDGGNQVVNEVVGRYFRDGSQSSVNGSIVAYEALHLLGILLQEVLNLCKVLLGNSGVLGNELGNLGLHSLKSGLQGAGISAIEQLAELSNSGIGSLVGFFEGNFS